ncbi:MAG: sulfate adenylyltransferase subunit CysD [Turneriella sp.]
MNMTVTRSHLDNLESEAVMILREVAGQFERPALLFSGGKDSIALVKLAEKAFRPAKFPFPLVHVDTGHNFDEVIKYRDDMVARIGERLIVASVEDSIRRGTAAEEKGKFPSRNAIQAVTLLEAIAEHRFDCCIGGARRDEEKARAKERIFSVRDEFGGWDPKNQRPELWHLYNGNIHHGENVRVFPLSNWTELDVWLYLKREKVELPSIYFAHQREVIPHMGQIFPISKFVNVEAGDQLARKKVRFRTVGDMTCTAAMESDAEDIDAIIEEVMTTRSAERGARLDDKRSEAAMEERKKGGYF